jgi:hypothetical protein
MRRLTGTQDKPAVRQSRMVALQFRLMKFTVVS